MFGRSGISRQDLNTITRNEILCYLEIKKESKRIGNEKILKLAEEGIERLQWLRHDHALHLRKDTFVDDLELTKQIKQEG